MVATKPRYTFADLLVAPETDELYEIYGTDARTVIQYTWGNGCYGKPVVLRAGDTLSCPLFPGITRDVAELFGGAA
jgi:hypothetical protein